MPSNVPLSATIRESDCQFIPLTFDFIDHPLYSEWSPESQHLYWLLRRYVCRSEDNHSLSNYFRASLLAVEGWQRQWATRLGVSRATIHRRLSEMVEKGIAQYAHKSTDREDPNILILGKWHEIQGVRVEIFFLDATVSNLKRSGDNHFKFETVSVSNLNTTNREEKTNKEEGIPKTIDEDSLDPAFLAISRASPLKQRTDSKIKNEEADEIDFHANPYLTADDVDEIERNPDSPKARRAKKTLRSLQSEGRSPTIPAHAGGADSLGDELLRIFCAHLHLEPSDMKSRNANSWRRELMLTISEWEGITFDKAIQALNYVLNFDSGPLKWMKRDAFGPQISSPFNKEFQRAFFAALGQAKQGVLSHQRRLFDIRAVDSPAELEASEQAKARDRKIKQIQKDAIERIGDMN